MLPPFDPIAELRRQNLAMMQGATPLSQTLTEQNQPQLAPPLSPQDESSLLSELGSAGGTALGAIGSVLDYLGRPIRGVLGGHPEELASLIPFSDTLGITSKENEVSGRGLLENWGVLDKQPEGAGFFDDPAGNLTWGRYSSP